MDMSHEAAKEAAFTISPRRRRVRGCRIVIQGPVSVTQGANRAEVDSGVPPSTEGASFSTLNKLRQLHDIHRNSLRLARNAALHCAQKSVMEFLVMKFNLSTRSEKDRCHGHVEA